MLRAWAPTSQPQAFGLPLLTSRCLPCGAVVSCFDEAGHHRTLESESGSRGKVGASAAALRPGPRGWRPAPGLRKLEPARASQPLCYWPSPPLTVLTTGQRGIDPRGMQTWNYNSLLGRKGTSNAWVSPQVTGRVLCKAPFSGAATLSGLCPGPMYSVYTACLQSLGPTLWSVESGMLGLWRKWGMGGSETTSQLV